MRVFHAPSPPAILPLRCNQYLRRKGEAPTHHRGGRLAPEPLPDVKVPGLTRKAFNAPPLRADASIHPDGVFLVGCLIVQFGVSEAEGALNPQGLDLVLFRGFQVIFAVSTLAIILIDIWGDILRAWRDRDET